MENPAANALIELGVNELQEELLNAAAGPEIPEQQVEQLYDRVAQLVPRINQWYERQTELRRLADILANLNNNNQQLVDLAVQALNDFHNERQQVLARRGVVEQQVPHEPEELHGHVPVPPDNDIADIFHDVAVWMFAEANHVAVGGEDPILDAAIPMEDAQPRELVPKYRDEYLSNKFVVGDMDFKDTADKPVFVTDLVDVEVSRHSWILNKFYCPQDQVDRDLVAFLSTEIMYMPRTPQLAIYMREKAKRWLSRYDKQALTRPDCEVLIGNAINRAYLPSRSEVRFVDLVGNWHNQYSLDRHNAVFTPGAENSVRTSGPKICGMLARVVRTPVLRRLIVGTVLFAYLNWSAPLEPLSPLSIQIV